MRLAAFAALAFGAVLALSASPAAAMTLSCTAGGGGPSGQDVAFTLADAIDARCYPEEGEAGNINDSEALFNDVANGGADPLFGMSGWELQDKNDDAISGLMEVVFTGGPINGDKSGTWDISSIAGYDKVVIVLKSAVGIGVFLIETVSGTWTSSKGLSHASIYTIGDPIAVPVPAGLPLLLTALGGLAFVSRRRRKA